MLKEALHTFRALWPTEFRTHSISRDPRSFSIQLAVLLLPLSILLSIQYIRVIVRLQLLVLVKVIVGMSCGFLCRNTCTIQDCFFKDFPIGSTIIKAVFFLQTGCRNRLMQQQMGAQLERRSDKECILIYTIHR